MKIRYVLVIVTLLAILFACGERAPEFTGLQKKAALETYDMEDELKEEKGLELAGEVDERSPKDLSIDKSLIRERKIIKMASIAIYVENLEQGIKKIEKITGKYNGLLTHKEINKSSADYIYGNITVWMPSENLAKFVEEISIIGKLDYSKLGTQDITEQYVDLSARLRNIKKQEERILKILDRKDAELEHVLRVEQELARIRTEIESLEGRRRNWDRQVQFSTVTISITQDVEKIKEPENIFKPLVRTFRKIKDLFLMSLSAIVKIVSVIIQIIIVLIPWFLAFIIIYFIIRLIIRLLKKKKE